MTKRTIVESVAKSGGLNLTLYVYHKYALLNAIHKRVTKQQARLTCEAVTVEFVFTLVMAVVEEVDVELFGIAFRRRASRHPSG